MVVDNIGAVANQGNDLADLDKALQNVRNSMEAAHNTNNHSFLKRNKSVPRSHEYNQATVAATVTPSRPRKLGNKAGTNLNYDTPDEEEELLDEALANAHKASRTLDHHSQSGHYTPANAARAQMAYMTPASSAHQHGVAYPQGSYTSKPMEIQKQRQQKDYTSQWPTPPYEESEWAAAASASIFAAQNAYR
jgi:meiosis induction protein kinase IME2/SME1